MFPVSVSRHFSSAECPLVSFGNDYHVDLNNFSPPSSFYFTQNQKISKDAILSLFPFSEAKNFINHDLKMMYVITCFMQ